MAKRNEASVIVHAMARGTVVLDENVSQLETALTRRNIRVLKPHPGTPDDEIKSRLLPNRIIITNNTKDFVDDASSYDYGIISLEGLPFIDPDGTEANKTVQLISKAIADHGLWARRHGFIVRLVENGRASFQPLTD